MAEDIVRVCRIIEYVGPRDTVEEQLRGSMGDGESRRGGRGATVLIRVATLGSIPEIVQKAVDAFKAKESDHGT